MKFEEDRKEDFNEETERSSMIKDRNKGIENITYNHLNLPTRITWANNKYISYQYNAAGQKVRKTVDNNDSLKIVDYLDGFQYAGNVLQFFPTAEGYVKATPTDRINSDYHFNYIYNYTDHLGNVRLSYTLDPQAGTLKIVNENHYYPFGLRHEIHYPSSSIRDFRAAEGLNGGQVGEPVELVNVTETEYMYKFQGQERQDELGLNWDSFKYRNYDYAIGRFMSIDPLAEDYSYQGPYNFSENRVIDAWELEGKEAKIISENQVEWRVKFQNSFVDREDYLSTEQIQSILAETSAILSQNELVVNIINDPNATYTIDANYPSASINQETGEFEGLVLGYAVGNTQTGVAYTNGNPQVIAHEMAHTAGLSHSFEQNSGIPNNEENKDNLMNSGENDIPELRNATGTELLPSQTQQIISTIESETIEIDFNK